MSVPTAVSGGQPGLPDFVGHLEGSVGPAQSLFGGGKFGSTERAAVHSSGTSLGGRTEANGGAAPDQCGTVSRAGHSQRQRNCVLVVAVHGDAAPADRFKTAVDIDAGGQLGSTFDGDLVVVVQHDQLAQAQVSGQIDRFVGDAFHQAAIADQHIGVVIDQFVAEAGIEHPLGQGHADRCRQALTEWSGGGLNPGAVPIFGMPSGL